MKAMGTQKQEPKRLKVAAYCRVSTDKEEQQMSFETQRLVYTDRIRAEPGWELAGIYADEGITGTSIRKRKQFQKMMVDCDAGKIDLIITKSISRFARNTLDCLQTVRELQRIGVDILFEKEHIDTRTPYSEMLLTILAAFAQEESRSISENLKWGIRSRYKEGKSRWSRIYGYTAEGDTQYIIVPEEAAVIQKIFGLYEHGTGVREIIRYLEGNHIPSPGGSARWYDTTIYDMFDSEKYVGDLILQKHYTIDHITHKEVKNDGAVPSYYIKDHHTPIISRETLRRVNAIRDMRRQNGTNGPGSGSPKTYPFGKMLNCPICGKTLIRRQCGVQSRGVIWCCDEGLNTASHFALWERLLTDAVLRAYAGVDIDRVKTLDSPAAKIMQEYRRQHPTLERVDYYWLDDLVADIEIGAHQVIPSPALRGQWPDDRSLRVIWKCGLETTVFSGVHTEQDNPRYLASLHTAHLQRRGLLVEAGREG